ncbi:MAG TPA: glycine cleavage T C-terminal barrel domain-containing protein [Pirellulales bacterium]|nr:glycine cleavage T C-terminal barrel domain-containing protein [Pirellulales bacterium]
MSSASPADSAAVDWIASYEALASHAGLVDLGARTQIELSGADRSAFLHNLCTGDIRKLPPGAGCEAFLTSLQGKTLAHLFAFVGPSTINLSTVSGQGEVILAHLNHYLVCEQVVLSDCSHQRRELYLGGPDAPRLLAALAGDEPPQDRLSHCAVKLAGRDVWIRKADLAGPIGFDISLGTEDVEAVRGALLSAGAVSGPWAAFDAARIEWGFPWFGVDISEKNLPQEVGRDKLAISFAKGCYLGQETVARIDALGHVNKTLVGVRFADREVPLAQQELMAAGEMVGHITSAAYSPRLGAVCGLAYVRRGHNTPGTAVTSSGHRGEVVALPFDLSNAR